MGISSNSLNISSTNKTFIKMNQKILFIGAILLFCGAVKSDELNQDNDNYYLNGFSIEQEEPIGTRREGDYYDAYPGLSENKNDAYYDKQGVEPADSALIAVVPGIAALLGVIVLAWVQANDQNNQQTQIDRMCTSARALGDTTLALTAGSDVQVAVVATDNDNIAARFNLIENAINAITTPACT